MSTFNLDQAEVVELKKNELSELYGGFDYSWAEFKQDCANAWDGAKAVGREIVSSFSSGFSSGSSAADATR